MAGAAGALVEDIEDRVVLAQRDAGRDDATQLILHLRIATLHALEVNIRLLCRGRQVRLVARLHAVKRRTRRRGVMALLALRILLLRRQRASLQTHAERRAPDLDETPMKLPPWR